MILNFLFKELNFMLYTIYEIYYIITNGSEKYEFT